MTDRRQAAEIEKLRKINRVLMDRVERDMDVKGGNAFSLFQTAITLESRVSERTAELTCLTRRLLHEVSERREAEAALLLAKAEAEQANVGKTRFLAAASHDLRQPLSAARLFIGALGEEVAAGRPRALVERAEAALLTVSELIDALLDISRLDAGAWPASPANFPIGPLLARLEAEYAPQAEACGLDLRAVRSAAVLHTDRALFERVLRNLIANAIRYTQAGRILVGCRRAGGRLRIEVWDTGIGIAPDKLGAVFEEFGRLGNAPRRDDKGVGLGLAIVDRIVRLLGLELHVASRVGRGSCFGVSVPLAAAPDPAELLGARRPTGLAGRTVALVEDDPAALGAIAALLDGWACRSVAAGSTDALLAGLDADGRAPDLIVADYHLDEGRLGGEAVEAVRARYGPMPGLIMSRDRSAALKARAGALGCAYLAKPVSPARLRSMLTYLLSEAAPDSRAGTPATAP